MLKYRFLTALILIPLVLWAVIALKPFVFSLITVMIFAVGAFEWAGLCDFTSPLKRGLYVGLFVAIAACLIGWHCQSVLLLGALFWCLAAYWILTYEDKASPLLQSQWAKALIGLLILACGAFALCVLQALPLGPLWIILLFVLVWGSDTFAFFAGRKWGKTPLAAAISPKKTIAGFWGGLIGTLFCAVMIFLGLKTQTFGKGHLMPFSAWLSIAYITLLLCVLGDLFESLIKRLTGVKDSGRLLPGHGGLLDRIDSLLAALPFYTLSLVWVTK